MTSTSDTPTPRRRFLSLIWVGLIVLALAEAVWVVASFLRPRRRRAEAGAEGPIVVAGPAERFDPGTVTAFQRGKFYLVRLEDGGFLALHRRCTHLGCTVPWVADESRFACPCHASAFNMRGEVLSPPAPRPLDHFPVRIENGIVKVDTRRALSRRSFDPSQVARI
jgi:cytochrome b6-f complex iron-sulfur subunit